MVSDSELLYGIYEENKIYYKFHAPPNCYVLIIMLE